MQENVFQYPLIYDNVAWSYNVAKMFTYHVGFNLGCLSMAYYTILDEERK